MLLLSLVEPVGVRTLVSTPAHEHNAFASPDGRFYAYQTDRDGQFEVWIRPLGASADGPVRVSVDGGVDPGWSQTGDEVFYRAPAGSIMAARVTTMPHLAVGEAVQVLAPAPASSFTVVGGRGYDTSPLDGRFLWARRPASVDVGIPVALNWQQELLAAMRD